MGMYTELIFGAKLKKETPELIINQLRAMIDDDYPVDYWEDPDHPFYDSRNPIRGGSYYFGVNRSVSRMWRDGIDQCWHISTRSNIKNYDGEIEKFLDWIKPWISEGSGVKDLYAVVIYEESEEPTLYYLD